jgi:hypothetical protein
MTPSADLPQTRLRRVLPSAEPSARPYRICGNTEGLETDRRNPNLPQTFRRESYGCRAALEAAAGNLRTTARGQDKKGAGHGRGEGGAREHFAVGDKAS